MAGEQDAETAGGIQNTNPMDPQATINDVVNNVKSEGIFDQFRKECLEEFDNMESYNQLKQTVENHVASFLSKRRFSELLQKNLLRTELRNHLNRSEVLLNGIQRLVDEVLSLKGHGFCLKIDKQVDEFLNPQTREVVEKTDKENYNRPSLENVEPPQVKDINNPYLQSDSKTIITTELNNERDAEETEVEEVGMEMDTEIMDIEKTDEVKEKLGQEQEEQRIDNVVKDEDVAQNKQQEEAAADATMPENKTGKDFENKSDEKSANVLGEENSLKVEETNESTIQQTPKSDEKFSSKVTTDIEENEPDLERKNNNISENESRNVVESVINNKDSVDVGNEETIKDEGTPELDGDALRTAGVAPLSHSYYTSLQTEPISDESPANSVGSYEQISDEDDADNENQGNIIDNKEGTNRRKSHRNRKAPSKYQQQHNEGKETDSSQQSDDKSRSKKTKQDLRSRSGERSTDNSNCRSRRRHEKREKSDTRNNTRSEKRKRSRSPRERKRDERNSSRSSSKNKRVTSPDELISKRPRRPTKQRERYSPS